MRYDGVSIKLYVWQVVKSILLHMFNMYVMCASQGENNNLIILITLKHNYRAVCTCTCVLHLIPL